MNRPFFEIKSACFVANKNKKINNFSLNIEKRGDIICLLGPSGVGKTTILRSIAGLQEIENGEIILNHKVLTKKGFSIKPEKRNIALAFQDNCLFPHKNTIDNIKLGLERKGIKKFIFSLEELIDIFQLENLLQKYPHEISSGEAQRVSLARSIISSPDLILLDEPFSNIDQILKEILQKKLKDILKKTRTSAIIVTHDPYEAFYLGDNCGIIIKNKLVQFDTPYNIYHYPNSLDVVNFLKRGITIKVKVLNQNQLKHKKLGLIYGKFGCSNLNELIPGSTVKLLIQPDDLEHDDKSNLKLKIVDRKFRGTNFIYTLKASSDEQIPVLVESHHQHLHENNEEFGVKTPISIDHLVCFV